MKKIHEFDNGIKVLDYHLLQGQRERYKKCNVHEEDEEKIFLSIVKSLPENATYVNVGAAIGYYPLLTRKNRPDIAIHCFEPLPRHLKYFRENIKLNGYEEDDFQVYDLAISSDSGSAEFVDNAYGSSLYSNDGFRQRKSLSRIMKDIIKKILRMHVGGKVIHVRTLGLFEIYKEIGCKKIDLLQMDIQGFEESVLHSHFSQESHSNIEIINFLIGTHGPDIHDKCRTCLQEAGYEIIHDEQDTQNQPDGILLASLDSGKTSLEQGSGGNFISTGQDGVVINHSKKESVHHVH